MNGEVKKVIKPTIEQEPWKTIISTIKPETQKSKKIIPVVSEDVPEPKDIEVPLNPIINPEEYEWSDDLFLFGRTHTQGGRPVKLITDDIINLRIGDTITLNIEGNPFYGTLVKNLSTQSTEGSLIEYHFQESPNQEESTQINILFKYFVSSEENSGNIYINHINGKYNIRIVGNRALIMTDSEYNSVFWANHSMH